MEPKKLKFSNCLIEALKLWIKNPIKRKICYDFNSPSRSISFYCRFGGNEYRFRRKLMRYGNKSKVLFLGYQQKIEINEKVSTAATNMYYVRSQRTRSKSHQRASIQ